MDVIKVFDFILVLLLGYLIQDINAEYSPPRIFPEESEYIIKSNDDFILRCEGKRPITWTSSNNSDLTDEPKFSKITIEPSKTPDIEYIYGSILTIHNASYMDTGYFYCHEDTLDFTDESKVAKIYLYVEDLVQLSVLSDLPTGIVVTQYSEAILPCRPTAPNVQVKLYQVTGEEIENVSYDPKIGFKFYPNDSIGPTICACHFNRTDELGNEFTQSLDILLYVTPLTFAIAKPAIEEMSGGHTIVGEKLELKCTIKVEVRFNMKWIIPDKNGIQSGRVNISKTSRMGSTNSYYQTLTIPQATLADQGNYICLVKDASHENNDTRFVRIFDNGEHFINLTEENSVYNISIGAGAPTVQWKIDVKAHPLPKLVWYNNKNQEIQAGWSDNMNEKKYHVQTNESNLALLRIHDVTINDRGFYYLKALNEFEEKKLPLFLDVTDKPTVAIELDSFHRINKPSVVTCTVAAYPEPSIYWFYKNCQDESCGYEIKNATKQEQQNMLLISQITISTNRSGYVQCVANNTLGSDVSIAEFLVSDVDNGFDIWGLDEDTREVQSGLIRYPIAVDETVTLYCGASKYNYTNELKWSKIDKNGLTVLESNDDFVIEKSETKFSYKLTLVINKITKADSAKYICSVERKEGLGSPATGYFRFENISISVRDPEPPIVVESNLNGSDYIMNLPDKFQLICYAKGIPKPTVTWYKNGVELADSMEMQERIEIIDDNRRIKFRSTIPGDEGSYTCKAANKVGVVVKEINLKFKNKPGFDYKYIIIIVVMIIIFIPTSLWLFFKLRKEQELRRELKRAGLANFENGALECLNHDLGVDDQAELLPYDKKYEFPREKLKLGKQLGAGAFGVVMKADAAGIVEGEENTTVAVKMVKRSADFTYLKALHSELKIMVHLGKHLNVVNLLGACTKSIAKRELLVIVEYCRFGNLHNYLLRHRDSFIDQIDPKTGKIDHTFGADILERSFSVSSSKSKSQSPIVKYAALSFSRSDHPFPNSMADYRGNFSYSGETAFTDTTAVSMSPTAAGEDSLISSNNSAQPEWRSNYRGDYKGNVKPICTKDLITWAFQVSRGMEYLASRKVLHGDLAARNILLAENNIVKICDFGLAKNMYKSDNYKKKGDGPLPVKWMAVESIRDRVFSTQSDVWSYGIVLWEFFSLARTPYPGMEADERLYNKLVDGYRMDAPQYATKEIYQVMCECWHPKPLCRPSFTKLAQTIGTMLEESVKQYYVDLNDPYLVMNTQRLEEGHSDYLAMFSPPDFELLSSPHTYVNDEIQISASPNPAEIPGYLCMKSGLVFSPRLQEESVFNFDVEANNRKHKNTNNGDIVANGVELLPMLHNTQSESDCETPNLFQRTPTTPTSYSNPTYHIPPSIAEKTDTDIVKSADNYVNMPQNKCAIKNDKVVKTNNCNGNPSNSTNNYVNSNSRDWERI